MTVYNGTSHCEICGAEIDPVSAMYDWNLCPQCKAQKRMKILKGRMAP